MSPEAKRREQHANDKETAKPELGGSFRTVRLVHIDFDDGSSVTAPEGEVSLARGVGETITDILDITCILFPRLCNPKPLAEAASYTITGPDGTEVTIRLPGSDGETTA